MPKSNLIPNESSLSSWAKTSSTNKYKVEPDLGTTSQKSIISHIEFKSISYIKPIETFLKDQVLKKLYNILDNLHKECEEENFPLFVEIARKNAKRVLKFIYKNFPDNDYHIYPTEDQEIAISCKPQKGRSVLILCDSKGGVACFATFEGKNRRFRYSDMADSLFKILEEFFKELSKSCVFKKTLSVSNSYFITEKWETNTHVFSIPNNKSFNDTSYFSSHKTSQRQNWISTKESV